MYEKYQQVTVSSIASVSMQLKLRIDSYSAYIVTLRPRFRA